MKGTIIRERIAVLKLDDIGDFIISSIFLKQLRSIKPNAHIQLWVNKSIELLAADCPYVDAVYSVDVSGLRRTAKRMRSYLTSGILCRPSKRPEIAYIPRVGPDYYDARILAKFIGVKSLYRFSEETKISKKCGILINDIKRPSALHEADANLVLLDPTHPQKKLVDSLEVWINESEIASVSTLLQKTTSGKKHVTMAPGAASGRRRWPAENYARVANYLAGKGYVIVLLGSQLDQKDCQFISDNCSSATSLSGSLSLRESLAVLAQASFHIGADSGLMHAAAALGLSGVAISCHPRNGSCNHENSPVRFGPYSNLWIIEQPEQGLAGCGDGCSKEFPHCILQVTVKAVIDALNKIIATEQLTI